MSSKKNKPVYSPLGALVSKIEGGGTPSKEVPGFWDGDIPLLTIKDLPNARLGLTVDRITTSGLESSSSKIVPAGIPVIATRMDVGRVVRCPVPVAINQDLRAIYPDPNKVDVDYIVQVLPTLEREFRRYSCGSTVMGIGIDDLKSVKIYLPPLAEQRKIAEILQTWDVAIETAEVELKAKQERKRGLMQKLLASAIKGKAVSGHRSVNIGDICNPQQWATIGQAQMTATGVPVYGANSFIGFFSESNHEEDVIAVSCRGSCGEVALVRGPSYVTGNSMCLDEVDDALVDVQWLYQCLKLRGFRDIVSGSAQPQIIRKDIVKVKLFLPSLREQKKVAEVLISADDEILMIGQLIESLRAQKRGLMQKLLTDEVRVAA